MKRRTLLASGLAYSANLVVAPRSLAQQPQTDPASIPPRFGQVGNRCFIPSHDGGSEATDLLAQTRHVLFDDVVGQMQVWWPNFRAMAGSGQAIGGDMEYSHVAASALAQVGFYDAVTGDYVVTPMVDAVTGAAQLAPPEGEFIKAVADIKARRGSSIYLRIRASFPQGMPYSQYFADKNNGDLLQFGSVVPDLAVTPINTHASPFWYGPSAILATTSRRSVGIIGDSREVGPADVIDDEYGNIGQFQRLFGSRLATINIGVPSGTAADFAVPEQSTRRRELMALCTDIAMGYGVNDIIFKGRKAEETVFDIQTALSDIGKPAIWKTLDPSTTPDFVTPDMPSNDLERLRYNAFLRDLPASYDPASVLENPGLPGAWLDKGFVAEDGTHETNAGNKLAAERAGFDYSLLGDPQPLDLLIPPLGPELTQDGSFDVSLGGWSADASDPPSIIEWQADAGGGRAVAVTDGASNARLQKQVPTYAGRAYRLRYQGGLGLGVGSQAGMLDLLPSASPGEGVFDTRTFIATGPTTWLNAVNPTQAAYLDQVSVREVIAPL